MHDDYKPSNIPIGTDNAIGKGVGIQTKHNNFAQNLKYMNRDYSGVYILHINSIKSSIIFQYTTKNYSN